MCTLHGHNRLLTATFLHAGLLHLGLNCYALYSLGAEVESVMGHRVFVAIYLLAGAWPCDLLETV